MHIRALAAAVLVSTLSPFACKQAGNEPKPAPADLGAASEGRAVSDSNPFFADTWTTPYQVPPFDRIDDGHFAPAFDEGMRRHRAEIDAIAQSSEPPTFANTLEALERTGDMLERVENVFFNLESANTNDRLQALRAEYAPRLSEHYDAVYLDAKLFARIKSLYDRRDEFELAPDQRKLLRDTYDAFVRAGAELDAAGKARLTTINSRLAELYTAFSKNVREESSTYELVIEDEADLAGLPAEVRASAAEEAKGRGKEGEWVFTLVRSSITPFLQYASNRELRQRIYEAYVTQGARGDARDNRDILKEAAWLRAERAALLGYPDHAHYMIANNMAKTPAAVHTLLQQLWTGALAKAKRERQALQELMTAELGPEAELQPWDWWYYAEKVRKQRYELSEEQLKPYFQVDAVRQGAFDTASRLFGITFEEVTDRVPRFHPEVKAFDVKNADGSHVGLLYVDYFPRKGKRTGAWMNVFRSQSNLDGEVRPVVVNVGNFPRPAAGKPALLGWDEVETLFHEFGHALHGLLSNVTYESQAGTNVKRDYVEFPSQVLENWASEPQVLKQYARHYETGEPIPDELIAKIKKAATFNQGFDTTELVAAALLDLEWHTLDVEAARQVDKVAAFDEAAMAKIGLIPEISPRYHSTYFQHIFTGDGYSAGYYVYLWAQVLEADAFAAFQEAGDIFDPDIAARLRRALAAGGSVDEMKEYVKLRGREPSVQPLLQKRGLEQ